MHHVGLVVVLLASISSVWAQSLPSTSSSAVGPTFEVALIKPNKSGATNGSAGPQPGGRWVMVNAPVARLIRAAYPGPTSQVIGAPAWVNSDRYDIAAKAEGEVTVGQMEAMLRALLADRFKLVVRVESREQEVYALALARTDRRLGPELRLATLDCAQFVELRPASGSNLPPRANGAPPCGLSADGRKLYSGGLTMAQLARNISSAAGRVVIDKTGLNGYYEFTLEYAARPNNVAGLPDDPGDNRPSLFTALQEQLGLKLESQRAPVDVLVIERIERPTED